MSKPKPASKPKSSIDSLFDSFEKGIVPPSEPEKSSQQKEAISQPKSLMSSIFESVKNSNESENETGSEKKNDEEERDDDDNDSKMKITKVYDFAGEAVE